MALKRKTTKARKPRKAPAKPKPRQAKTAKPRIRKPRFKQGKFTPQNPEKYIGDIKNIIYRSSWELQFFKLCDTEPAIISWGSEIIAIPYNKPVPYPPGWVVAKYYPDVYMVYVNKAGKTIKELVEIKPSRQTRKSKAKTPEKRLAENYVFAVNSAKWQAAKEWCAEKGIVFSIKTEKSLMPKR